MPSSAHVVTFPGKVRIVDAGTRDPSTGKRPAVVCTVVKNPKFTHPDTNARFRNETVTRVTVPAGYRLDYEFRTSKRAFPGQKPEKPLALVKVVPDSAPAPVLHAELEHVTEATTKEIVQGHDLVEGKRLEPRLVETTMTKVVGMKATSLQYPELVGEGEHAAEAAADLRKKIADKKAAAKPELVERVGAPEAIPALPPAEESKGDASKDEGEPKVTRQG